MKLIESVYCIAYLGYYADVVLLHAAASSMWYCLLLSAGRIPENKNVH